MSEQILSTQATARTVDYLWTYSNSVRDEVEVGAVLPHLRREACTWTTAEVYRSLWIFGPILQLWVVKVSGSRDTEQRQIAHAHAQASICFLVLILWLQGRHDL